MLLIILTDGRSSKARESLNGHTQYDYGNLHDHAQHPKNGSGVLHGMFFFFWRIPKGPTVNYSRAD